MKSIDPYAVLGIVPGAAPRQVEAAWRRMEGRRPPLSAAERAAAEAAYLLLADPQRRAAHDRARGLVAHPGLFTRSPGAARAYFEAGVRAMDRGRWDQAHEAFRRAVDCQPWEAAYRSHLGVALASAGGDTHQARDHCLQALRLDPGNVVARRHLARVYEMAGLHARSRSVLEKGSL